MTGSPTVSYAAIWAEGEGPRWTGSVALAEVGLELTGGKAVSAGETTFVPYADVVGVGIVRDQEKRLNGYPTLRIEQRRRPPLRISTIGLGVLGELQELLATAILQKRSQPQLVAIVLPLRKRALADAAALIEQGPPFDLAALGVARHEILLSEDEVIFLFEGPRLEETIQQLVRDTSVWRAASSWTHLTAGPPRLADQRFGWHSGRRTR
jgi:hypothetical protein